MYFQVFNKRSSPQKRNQVENLVVMFMIYSQYYLQMLELWEPVTAI